jgi:anhydro-N-acetylmuramic acid kinase
MTVAGVMSGTSADGVDVAIVRITPGDPTPKVKVLAHESFPYSKPVRTAVLRAMDAKEISVAELSRLNWRLGQLYADCIGKTVATSNKKPALVGLHGQTLYHQSIAQPYLGAQVRATWQLGEAAVVAERLRIPIISDLRPADLAAGGQGAPLVPMLDFCMFRSPTKNRVLLNLGGIANVTAIPAGAGLNGLLAFDTGPANMVIDALMQKLYARNYDAGGKTAAQGRILPAVVDQILKDKYFNAPPPKSCGREQFGAAFVSRVHQACLAAGANSPDIIATATEITVRSIVEAYAKFCWSHLGQRAPLARATEMIVAGGGARNTSIMTALTTRLGDLGVKVIPMDQMGVAAQAKEAAAFALLAWLRWFGLPGNVPSATGARRPVVLGKVSLG